MKELPKKAFEDISVFGGRDTERKNKGLLRNGDGSDGQKNKKRNTKKGREREKEIRGRHSKNKNQGKTEEGEGGTGGSSKMTTRDEMEIWREHCYCKRGRRARQGKESSITTWGERYTAVLKTPHLRTRAKWHHTKLC